MNSASRYRVRGEILPVRPGRIMCGSYIMADFLRTHEDEQHITHAAAKAGEASLAPVWNNDEDAAYDDTALIRRGEYGNEQLRR